MKFFCAVLKSAIWNDTEDKTYEIKLEIRRKQIKLDQTGCCSAKFEVDVKILMKIPIRKVCS